MADNANNEVPPIPAPPHPVEAPPAPAANVPPAAQSPYGQPAPHAQPAPNAQPVPPQYGAVPAAPQNPYGQPSPYPAPGYVQPAFAPRPPQGLAVASMVLGIGGLFLTFFSVGFLFVVAAVITGHMAYRKQPTARALALTGLITGYIGLGISLIWGLIFGLAILASFAN